VKKKRKIDTVKNYDKSIVELLTKSDEDEKIKNIIASTGSVSHNDDVNGKFNISIYLFFIFYMVML
jgi:hypothetical protein